MSDSAIGRLVPTVFLLMLLGLGPGTRSHAAELQPATALSGVVRDTVGNLLTDVEVLFSEPLRPQQLLGTARTDGAGKFEVPGLAAGTYTVAALKEGYDTFVGQVNALVGQSLALVLRPSVGGRYSEPVPEDPSWALRLPRRGVLHQLEPDGAGYGSSDLARAQPATAADSMQMTLDQLFSVSAPTNGDAAAGAQLQATETRMALNSAIGEYTNLRVEGRHERFGAEGTENRESKATENAQSMAVGLRFDTGDDRVDLNAYYDRQDLELAAGPGALGNKRLSWGYDARWARRLDERNQVALSLDYHDTAASAGFGNRSVSAEGRLERVNHRNHELDVAVTAQVLNWPVQPAIHDVGFVVPPRGTLSGAARWSLAAEAWHRWTVAAPWQLLTGLSYRHALLAHDATMVVPRFGAQWANGDWQARGVLSYHASLTENGGDAQAFSPGGRLGYDAEFRMSLGRGVSLRGGASRTPVQFTAAGRANASGSSRKPMYLTDGNAEVGEERIALVSETRDSHVYLELARGDAEGSVAALVPLGTAYQVVSESELRFSAGRLGVDLPRRGTNLLFEYQRVAAESPTEDETRKAIEEWIEVRLRQQMLSLPVPGDWRFLLAVRLGSVAAESLESWTVKGGDTTPLDALNRRVSAGVSVMF